MSDSASHLSDLSVVLHDSLSDSYEISRVLLAKAGFDGKLQLLPSGWERALGFRRAELASKTLRDLMWCNTRSTAAAATSILDEQNANPVDVRLRCRDGRGKDFRLHRHYDRRERMMCMLAEEIPRNPAMPMPARGERRITARHA
jgi:PAS domain-containing protein